MKLLHSQRHTTWLKWAKRSGWRAVSVLVVVGVIGILAYTQIIRPGQHAARYRAGLDHASRQLASCFESLEATRHYKVFATPDLSKERQLADVGGIKDAIQSCHRKLDGYHEQAQSLHYYRYGSYSHSYRQAQLDQRQALNVAGQSRDVLYQYENLANFLEQYYRTLEAFERYTTTLNNLGNVSLLSRQTKQLAEQGASLHQQAARLRQLQAYTGFETTIQPSALMLDKAADGYDYLASGYGGDNQVNIRRGFQLVETAVADYDSQIRTLLFDKLQQAYVLQQVDSLPAKLR